MIVPGLDVDGLVAFVVLALYSSNFVLVVLDLECSWVCHCHIYLADFGIQVAVGFQELERKDSVEVVVIGTDFVSNNLPGAFDSASGMVSILPIANDEEVVEISDLSVGDLAQEFDVAAGLDLMV